MKFELKTENDIFSKPFFTIIFLLIIISITVITSSISLKLGNISRHYEINYLCKLLTIDRSKSTFKKLSKLSKQTSKQKIWDLCREIVK